MFRGRDDYITPVGAEIDSRPDAGPVRQSCYRGGIDQLASAAAGVGFGAIGEPPELSLKLGQAFIAAMRRVDVQDYNPGGLPCGDADVGVRVLAPPRTDGRGVG